MTRVQKKQRSPIREARQELINFEKAVRQYRCCTDDVLAYTEGAAIWTCLENLKAHECAVRPEPRWRQLMDSKQPGELTDVELLAVVNGGWHEDFCPAGEDVDWADDCAEACGYRAFEQEAERRLVLGEGGNGEPKWSLPGDKS